MKVVRDAFRLARVPDPDDDQDYYHLHVKKEILEGLSSAVEEYLDKELAPLPRRAASHTPPPLVDPPLPPPSERQDLRFFSFQEPKGSKFFRPTLKG